MSIPRDRPQSIFVYRRLSISEAHVADSCVWDEATKFIITVYAVYV